MSEYTDKFAAEVLKVVMKGLCEEVERLKKENEELKKQVDEANVAKHTAEELLKTTGYPAIYCTKKGCEDAYNWCTLHCPNSAFKQMVDERVELLFERKLDEAKNTIVKEFEKRFHKKFNELIPFGSCTLAQWEQLGPVDILEIVGEVRKELEKM